MSYAAKNNHFLKKESFLKSACLAECVSLVPVGCKLSCKSSLQFFNKSEKMSKEITKLTTKKLCSYFRTFLFPRCSHSIRKSKKFLFSFQFGKTVEQARNQVKNKLTFCTCKALKLLCVQFWFRCFLLAFSWYLICCLLEYPCNNSSCILSISCQMLHSCALLSSSCCRIFIQNTFINWSIE
jgi:hypothetical protein